MKILIVEDNELNREMLSRRLIRKGFEIITAVNGQSAIKKVKSEQPDIVIMDLSLPVLNGWEVAERLKSDKNTQAVPIIALTAHAMKGDMQKALDAGCNDYDTKPVNFERLLNKINKLTFTDMI